MPLPRDVVPTSGVGFEGHGGASNLTELRRPPYPTKPPASSQPIRATRSVGLQAKLEAEADEETGNEDT
jgi:hypothetical protein